MFVIEKNVPIPSTQGRKRVAEFPLAKLKVGDSFLVKVTGKGADAGRATLWRHTSKFKKDNDGVEFAVRTVRGGVRVWRTA